jgi:serine/threonine protein kinase
VIKMLNKNPEQRITAMEALNSEWMNNADENQELTDVGNEVMKNLQGFHVTISFYLVPKQAESCCLYLYSLSALFE